MITDRLATVGLGVNAIVNSGSTVKVGDVIDLGMARDIGNGADLYMLIQVDTDFVGSGASFELRVVSSAATDLSTPTTHWTSGTLALATAPNGDVGQRWQVLLPIGDYLRYLGLTITGSGANITAGKLDAFIQTEKQKWAPFKEAIS